MIINSAKKMASFFVVANVIKNEEKEIYQYGLELIISSVLNILAVVLLSVLFNRFLEAICFLTYFISLRSYTGGIHASSYRTCFLTFISIYISSFLISFVVPINIQSKISVIVMLFVSIIIVLFYPIQNDNKPLNSDEIRKFRLVSIRVVLSQTILILLMTILSVHIEALIFSAMIGAFSVSLLVLTEKIIKRKEVKNEVFS